MAASCSTCCAEWCWPRDVIRRLDSFDAFWPHYLREHARPATRAVHVGGTWLAVAVLMLGVITLRWWLLPVALVIGYGAAWVSHRFIERNRPASFAYPFWSLLGDLRMAGLAATGRLGSELRRHGL